MIDQLVYQHFFLFAFDLDIGELFGKKTAGQKIVGGLADDDVAGKLFGELLDAGSGIDSIAHQGV